MFENIVHGIIGDSLITEIILTAAAKNIGGNPSDGFIYSHSEERCKYFREQYNARAVTNADEFFSKANILMLAFKLGDDFENELDDIAKKIPRDALIICYVRGMKIADIEKYFPKNPVVRVTMNPMIVAGAGVGAYAVGSVASADVESLAQFMMSKICKVIKVDSEDELEKVSDLILGGTVYTLMAINALIEGGTKKNLSLEKSQEIVTEVVKGTVETLMKSDDVIKYLLAQGQQNGKEIIDESKKILEDYGVLATLSKSFDFADVKEIFKFRYHYWE